MAVTHVDNYIINTDLSVFFVFGNLFQVKDELKLFLGQTLNAQSRAREKREFGQSSSLGFVLEMNLFELFERNEPFEISDKLDVHHKPPRLGLVALGIEVRIFWIELSVIHIRFLDDVDNSGDARILAIAVIKEGLLADFHCHHVVPGLIVPHPVPMSGLIRLFGTGCGTIKPGTT